MSDTLAVIKQTGFTPSTEVDEVFAYLGETLCRLERMFVDGCARSAEHIELRMWMRFDPNLYAHEVLVHLRVRRSKNGDVPKAGSGNLMDFYQGNLFSSLATTGEVLPLNLMLLWDVDTAKQFRRFWLGCPKEDGVHWHWRRAILMSTPAVIDTVNHGKAFREAFEAENSDVPMTRVEGEPEKRSTGTDDTTGK